MADDRPRIQIYTDGGCDPNPGPGGWGVVLIHPKKTRELSGGEPDTTNNRMELTAVIEALRALKGPCTIDLYTDSKYVKQGITEWINGWAANGWRKGKGGKGDPVLNADLWQTLYELAESHEIRWHWVRGHAGDRYNERADQLASAAIPRAARPADPDAACVYLRIAGPRGSRGAGGWAAAVVRGDETITLSGRHPDTTANHLAIYAAIEALKQLPPGEKVQVYTNNSYLHDGITKWVKGWRASGWVKKTDGKPVKFRDAWQRLDEMSRARGVAWVRFGEDEPEAFKALRELAEAERENNTNDTHN